MNLKIFTDGSGKIFGQISGIDSIEAAREFTNKEIFIDKDMLPELGEKEYYWDDLIGATVNNFCLLYTSPSPRDLSTSRMPSSA